MDGFKHLGIVKVSKNCQVSIGRAWAKPFAEYTLYVDMDGTIVLKPVLAGQENKKSVMDSLRDRIRGMETKTTFQQPLPDPNGMRYDTRDI